VFKDLKAAPKKHSDSWWAVLKLHYQGYDHDPSVVSVLLRAGFGQELHDFGQEWGIALIWMVWILAVACASFIASSNMLLLSIYLSSLVLAVAWIPDNGTSVVPYSMILVLIPIVAFKAMSAGGWWTTFPFIFIFTLLPIVETFVGVELTNQTAAQQKELHHAFRFKLLTLLVLPVQALMICYGCWWANHSEHSVTEFIGGCWCVGIFTGAIGITVGHELCHKASSLERWSGRLLLCSVSYGHFYVEHTLGHHKLVCTDEDPATARYGENFWAFLPRVVIGEFLSAIHIESDRIKRKNLPWYHHEVPLYSLVSIAMCCAYVHAFGSLSIAMFFGQSAAAVLLFESVNYLEHYGLERRQDKMTGKYEAVQPQHSWDSPAKLTNMVLIKLQRHADHHAHAGKRFQTLQLYEESPQLPSGEYAICDMR
jgi:alkane 1-monooxygenase